MLPKRILLTIFLLTLLGQKTFGQKNNDREWRGVYTGFGLGAWLQQNHTTAVGDPAVVSVSRDFKFGLYSCALVFDLVYNETDAPVTIKYGNQLVSVNDYNGGQFTLDFGREMWRSNRLMLETVCGAGYGNFTYYKIDNDHQVSKSSFVVNHGLSLRYLYGRKGFLQLKAQYNMANYKLNDIESTDFHGNYFTIKLIVGSVSRGSEIKY